MKKKQFYEKPSMKVFPLRRKPQLLVGSATSPAPTSASFDDYEEDNTFSW